jgi:hypothetical protein
METALYHSIEVSSEYIVNSSSIVHNYEFEKIISYFPEERRNFKIKQIYNSSKDSDTIDTFKEKVFNQGPTLIILKTTKEAICGGYTSKSWDGQGKFTKDDDAFVFNMTQKYTPNNHDKAIYT